MRELPMSDIAVLVFVTVGHASTPAATSMLGAAQQMLGPGARIVIETVEEIPADDDVVLLADMTDVDAIVEVTWPADSFNRASVRVWPTRRHQWVERELTFTPNDTAAERGRTVGFTFAAMIPDRPAEVSTPATSPLPTPAGAAPATVVDRGSPATRTIPPMSSQSARASLDARATFALAGAYAHWGGAASANWWFSGPSWYARATAEVRSADLEVARTLDIRPSIAIGRELRIASTSVGARLEALLLVSSLTRVNDSSDRRIFASLGAAAVLDAATPLFGPVDVVAHGGLEVVTTETRVYVDDNVVVRLPRTRLVTGVGLRLRF